MCLWYIILNFYYMVVHLSLSCKDGLKWVKFMPGTINGFAWYIQLRVCLYFGPFHQTTLP